MSLLKSAASQLTLALMFPWGADGPPAADG